MDSGFVQCDQASLYYEKAGAGLPVVFIHAGVADCRQWDREFPSFARDHEVLRFDMRGYGRSLPVDGPFSHLSDFTTVLDRLGMDGRLVLVGCSMGGTMALDFTLAHPSRVRALVLVGSAPGGLRLAAEDHPMEADAEEANEAGDLDRAAELEAQIWFDGVDRTADRVDAAAREKMIEMNRLALAHAALGLGTRLPAAEPAAATRLHEIAVPLLALVGAHDLEYFRLAADLMEKEVRGARKVVFDNAAHLLNMEHPARCEEEVRSFLAG